MSEENKGRGDFDPLKLIAHDLHRIANSQERLLQIAEEARAERKEIGDAMKKKFQTGFQAKE